jgi:CYTH domain-containing protein
VASAKYAVGEYERRFLLDAVPPGVANPRRIVDRYIESTRLRLRTVHHPDGAIEHKLGHKRRPVATDPTVILHTSLYLDDEEHAVMAALPARDLHKTRWAIDLGAGTGSVNVFDAPLTGLILLEVDLDDPDRLTAFEPPSWAGPEVTRDEAFTGGALAGRTMDDLAPSLAAVGSRWVPGG